MSSLSSFSYFNGISSSRLILHPCNPTRNRKCFTAVSFCYSTTTTFPLSYLLHGISITRNFVQSYLLSSIQFYDLRYLSPVFFVCSCHKEAKHGIPKIYLIFSAFLLRKISSISLSRAWVIFLIICSTWRTRNNKTRPPQLFKQLRPTFISASPTLSFPSRLPPI